MRHWKPEGFPCDLHALGTPPAFVLSQDQTLHSWTSPTRRGSADDIKDGPFDRPPHDSVVKVRADERGSEQKTRWVARAPDLVRGSSIEQQHIVVYPVCCVYLVSSETTFIDEA